MNNAFLLHSRPYRETSALVDLLCAEHGKIRVVVKGIKRNARHSQQLRGVLQPFQAMTCEWRGKGELKTLYKAEVTRPAYRLFSSALYSGIYLNELLLKLLNNVEDTSALYRRYEQTLVSLASLSARSKSPLYLSQNEASGCYRAQAGVDLNLPSISVGQNSNVESSTGEINDSTRLVSRSRAEDRSPQQRDSNERETADKIAIELRKFEFYFISALGYGIDFNFATNTGEPIEAQLEYQFLPEQGFLSLNEPQGNRRVLEGVFRGSDILAIRDQQWGSQQVRSAAKRLARMSLSHLLEGDQVVSREFFSPA